jgi:hypothetical protein
VAASADKISTFTARVVKLVDTADLKSAAFPKGGVSVRSRSRAPVILFRINHLQDGNFLGVVFLF